MSDPKVAVAIQHAPWAADRVPLLHEFHRVLERESSGTFEFFSSSIVVKDAGTQKDPEGVWPVNRRCWMTALALAEEAGGVSHVWVAQDDMIPRPGFAHNLKAIIELYPDRVLSLLLARKDVHKAAQQRIDFVELQDGTWGGCTVMPVDLAVEFLAWEDEYVKPACGSADARVDLWLRKTGKTAIAPVPSLIQHFGDRSLIGHTRNRRGPLMSDGPQVWRAEPTLLSPKGLNYHMFKYLREVE